MLHCRKTPPVSRGSLKHISGRGRAAMRTPWASRWAIVASRSSTWSATECMPPPNRDTNRAAPPSTMGWPTSIALSPTHAMPPRRPMPGLGGLAVLEHRQPHERAEVPDGEVVVGHHRGRVEQPAHVVPPGPGRRHRPAVTGSSTPVMLRAPGPGQEHDGVGDVGGLDVAPQRRAGGQAAGHVVGRSPVRAAIDSIMASSGGPVVKPGVTTLTRTPAGPAPWPGSARR